jgi:hypothetical protein
VKFNQHLHGTETTNTGYGLEQPQAIGITINIMNPLDKGACPLPRELLYGETTGGS